MNNFNEFINNPPVIGLLITIFLFVLCIHFIIWRRIRKQEKEWKKMVEESTNKEKTIEEVDKPFNRSKDFNPDLIPKVYDYQEGN